MKRYLKLISCLVIAYGLVGVMGCNATERSSKNDAAKALLSLEAGHAVSLQASPTDGSAAQGNVLKRKRAAEEDVEYTTEFTEEDEKRLNDQEGSLVCQWCFITLTKKCSLERHIKRQHTGEREFRCSDEGCGKAFVDKYSLKVHERKHKNERPYPCRYPKCPKASRTSTNRIKHEKTHERKAALAAAGKQSKKSKTPVGS